MAIRFTYGLLVFTFWLRIRRLFYFYFHLTSFVNILVDQGYIF